jgi:hypothetical protein
LGKFLSHLPIPSLVIVVALLEATSPKAHRKNPPKEGRGQDRDFKEFLEQGSDSRPQSMLFLRL